MVAVSPHRPPNPDPPPDPDAAGPVAGLAREVDGLRRRLDPLDRPARAARRTHRHRHRPRLETRRVDRAPRADAVPVLAAGPHPRTRHHPPARRTRRRGWKRCSCATATPRLPECWLWHPDVVEELLWLSHAWLAAYQGPAASVALAADWHDRLRPGVVRRIKAQAGSCSRERHQTRPGRDRLTTGIPPVARRRRGRGDRRLVGTPPGSGRPRTRHPPPRSNPRPRRRPAADHADRGPVPMTTPRRPPTPSRQVDTPTAPRRALRAVIWLPGLAVALGAAAATAHGLYQVALAARGPGRDRLALPADHRRAGPGRLRRHRPPDRARRPATPGPSSSSPPACRGWRRPPTSPPAPPSTPHPRCGSASAPGPRSPPRSSRTCSTSCSTTRHRRPRRASPPIPPTRRPPIPRPSHPRFPNPVRRPPPAPHRSANRTRSRVYRPPGPAVQPPHPSPARVFTPTPPTVFNPITTRRRRRRTARRVYGRMNRRSAVGPAEPRGSARDRARAAAVRHATRHGALPTVTELEAAAHVSRGTAATVLRTLRDQPTPLHLITNNHARRAPTPRRRRPSHDLQPHENHHSSDTSQTTPSRPTTSENQEPELQDQRDSHRCIVIVGSGPASGRPQPALRAVDLESIFARSISAGVPSWC